MRSKSTRAWIDRGGVVPFNVLPIGVSGMTKDSAASFGHGAGTPLALCDWWVRYITQPGWTVLDPFAGTSTVGKAALAHGCSYIGFEKMPEYIEISRTRLATAQPALMEVESSTASLQLAAS
jgi:DNA modification methylase